MSFSLTVLALAAVQAQSPTPEPQYVRRGYPGFGSVVAKTGDANGDGVPDLILGDPGQKFDGVLPRFWIVSGKDGSVVRSIKPELQDASQFSIEGGVDLDGDDVADLLIAPSALESSTKGIVYLVSGKDGRVQHRIATCDRDARSRDAVHFISDIDRDGVSDLAVLCLSSGDVRAALSVYSGRTGERVKEIEVANEMRADLGAFADVGDVDGDGALDFAVLLGGETIDRDEASAIAPERARRRAVASSLVVYSSADARKLWETHSDPKWHSWNRASLARIDDVRGHPKLVYGIDARVELVESKTGKSLARLKPKGDDEGFGYVVAGVGDIDHDEVFDFVYTVFDTGTYDGRVVAVSGREGKPLWQVESSREDDDIHHLGNDVAVLGDVDGDGVADLAIATQMIINGTAGIAEVRSGKTGALLFRFRRSHDDVVVTRRGSAPAEKR